MEQIGQRHGRRAANAYLWATGLAAVYFALSRLSLEFLSESTGAATMWPAAGVALAVFAIARTRDWPILAAGVLVGNLAAQLTVREDVGTALGLSVVNALEPIFAAWVLGRVAGRGRVDLTQVRGVGGIAAAAFGANAVTAVLGAAVLVLAFGGPALQTWETWWLADGVGMLAVAPVLLAFLRSSSGRASRLENVALVWLTGAITLAIFFHAPGEGAPLLGVAFPVLPMLLWCSVRLGTRGITAATLLVATIACLATADGRGPFAVSTFDSLGQIQVLQGFLALSVLSTLIVAAVVASQRRAETQARAEADRLETILRASESAIIGLDLRGRITLFNPGAERLLGYRAEEVLGRSDLAIHDDAELAKRAAELDLQPGFELFVHAALRNERRDWTYIRQDGQRRRVALTMSAQRDQHGRLVGFLAMADDVTERREQQRRLIASEERHRLVLANLGDAQVYLFDTGLRCVFAEGRAVPDIPEVEFLDQHLTDLLAPGDVEQLLPMYVRALAGEPGHTEYTSSVTGRDHELHVEPYRLPGGDIDGVVVVMRDITERATAEAEVRQARADLRTIFDAAPIGNAVLDERLRIVDANPALAAITGYDVAELHGVSIDRFLDLEDVVMIGSLVASVGRGEEADAELELAFRHAEGHVVDLALHAVGLDGGRTLIQIVDMSDHKRLEERLRSLAEHDALTGLVNRRRFDSELAAQVDRARRYGHRGALILIDLDGFKAVNDTQGHDAGDALLVDVAEVLHGRVRSSDVLARLGGDEFAVVLPEANRNEAAIVAAGLGEAVRAELDITLSLGVATLADTEPMTVEQLFRNADRALYAAKAAGRDGYAVFGDLKLTPGPAEWPGPRDPSTD